VSNSDRLRRTQGATAQINLGFGSSSTLLQRLKEAQRATGRTPTRIAREVLEDYLDLWLSARLREQRVIAEAKRQLQDDGT
jgi:predicted DNA-binding protein